MGRQSLDGHDPEADLGEPLPQLAMMEQVSGCAVAAIAGEEFFDLHLVGEPGWSRACPVSHLGYWRQKADRNSETLRGCARKSPARTPPPTRTAHSCVAGLRR